jgi:type VI secretion system protein ImpE
MQAQELFRAGKLDAAIAALGAQLRDDPGNLKTRTFLFELLCFSGDYDRAEKQLNVVEQEGVRDSFLGTLVYKAALAAERTRQAMFRAEAYPVSMEHAANRRVGGKLNGRHFHTIRDADSRMREKLEVFAGGDYLWIAFHDISSLRMEAPRRLRELLWIPARVKTAASFRSRDLGEVLLPAVAPLSWQHPDGQVRLGRVSEWCEDENGNVAPFGAKTLLVDGEEVPLLEVRELEMEAVPAAREATVSAR